MLIILWVGLLGGFCYVNVVYIILETKSLKKTEKEVALLISTAYNDIGILAASILAFALNNTVYFELY